MLTIHKGNQIRRDLNIIVGRGKNWNIPAFWVILLRYISAPVLSIIFSFAYPEFHTLRNDPMMITGFILAHFCLVIVALGFIVPRYADILIPPPRRSEGTEETFANEPKEEIIGQLAMIDETEDGEKGMGKSSSQERGEEDGTGNKRVDKTRGI